MHMGIPLICCGLYVITGASSSTKLNDQEVCEQDYVQGESFFSEPYQPANIRRKLAPLQRPLTNESASSDTLSSADRSQGGSTQNGHSTASNGASVATTQRSNSAVSRQVSSTG